jgi:chemotaxis signal transduction protein
MHQHLSLSSSQARFLEELSDDAFWKYAREMAFTVSAVPPQADQYLLCELDSGWYLLSLAPLLEIVPAPYHYTLLPIMPAWMCGLAGWRGEVIPVVELDAYLRDRDKTLSLRAEGNLLIAQWAGRTFGLYVPTPGTTLTLEHIQEDAQELLAAKLSEKRAWARPDILFEDSTEYGMSDLSDMTQEAASSFLEARGLLVSTFAGAWILDMQALLMDITQQIAVLAHE